MRGVLRGPQRQPRLHLDAARGADGLTGGEAFEIVVEGDGTGFWWCRARCADVLRVRAVRRGSRRGSPSARSRWRVRRSVSERCRPQVLAQAAELFVGPHRGWYRFVQRRQRRLGRCLAVGLFGFAPDNAAVTSSTVRRAASSSARAVSIADCTSRLDCRRAEPPSMAAGPIRSPSRVIAGDGGAAPIPGPRWRRRRRRCLRGALPALRGPNRGRSRRRRPSALPEGRSTTRRVRSPAVR